MPPADDVRLPTTTGYTVTIRLSAPTRPVLLPRLAQAVAATGAVVTGMDLVEVTIGGTTVDLTVLATGEDHVAGIVAALEEQESCRVRRVSDPTFLHHLGGKIDVVPRKQLRTRQDLSMAYTPGVARVASAIAARPEDAWTLTGKGNSVAIVTDGTAVLGLGDLGPLAALPVMEGKSVLFREFGGVSAYPLCLRADSADELVRATLAIAPGFGGINLEDIAAPRCFEVEARLQAELDIPVFHDDQHGTAVVVTAGLVNACRMTGRRLDSARAVLVGAGAAGTAIAKALLAAGLHDLVVVDRDGVIRDDAGSSEHHRELAARTNPRGVTDLTTALTDADIFIGTARRGSVDPQALARMAAQPIVFALANPEPEVAAEELREDALLATGRSDLPNQINNSLCFPGFFRGALDARARRVTEEMKLAAARAVADSITPEQLTLGIIVPTMFQSGVHDAVAAAVAEAWRSGAPVDVGA